MNLSEILYYPYLFLFKSGLSLYISISRFWQENIITLLNQTDFCDTHEIMKFSPLVSCNTITLLQAK
jgi:hypothetical protein